jgi:PAT family beta-lactamase induction signal transducer AmpG
MSDQKNNPSPWSWVPSLYFAQGFPYILVIVVSTIIYKNLGLSNTQITFYTGWFYLPWVIKPFWSPFIDHFKTKRFWVITTQLMMGALIAAIGLTLPTSSFVQWSMIFFWLVAFSSATHDIAADGFYMLGLTSHQQSFFVGIRNTFWRVAAIAGQGGLVYLSGILINHNLSIKSAWMIVLTGAGIVYAGIAIYHKIIMPKPVLDPEMKLLNGKKAINDYFRTIVTFFKRKNIVAFLLFILFYRLGEAQLSKLAAPFLLDTKAAGGLALTNEQVGLAYGTIGIIGLVLGGISGGFVVAKKGLKFWIWPMALAMKLPDIVYVVMAHYQPTNAALIQGFIALEQFGYGFGFTAFTLYLIYFVQGNNRTSHYAIATGLMALGMMVPGMLSGWIQELLNYENFFIWVVFCTLPGLILIPFLKIDKDFGKKNDNSTNTTA